MTDLKSAQQEMRHAVRVWDHAATQRIGADPNRMTASIDLETTSPRGQKVASQVIRGVKVSAMTLKNWRFRVVVKDAIDDSWCVFHKEILTSRSRWQSLRFDRDDADDDPNAKFVPSNAIRDLVRSTRQPLDSESLQNLRAHAMSTGAQMYDHVDVNEMGDRMEGLLTNLAFRAVELSQDEVAISDGRRFSPEISEELLWRLDIDPYAAGAILNRLFRELQAFARTPRLRPWGQYRTTERGELKLIVDRRRAVPLPDLAAIPRTFWSSRDFAPGS